MISCLLSCAHQTHGMINVYHGHVISYLYPALYHILSLSYLNHQTKSKNIKEYSGTFVNKIHKQRKMILCSQIVTVE